VSLELIAYSLLGVFCGIFTGLVPGIHVNTAAPLAMELSNSSFIEPMSASVFICCMSITHTFIDFIPATILGIPDPDMSLAVLPAHRMVLSGRGWEAICLSGVASLLSVVIITASLPLLMYVFEIIYPVISSSTLYLLIFFSIITIYAHKSMKKIILALFVFLLSGIFGYAVLENTMLFKDPLMPVFSGFFGMSSLIMGLAGGKEVPKQDFDDLFLISKKNIIITTLKGTFSGILVSTVPGIGASQATILSNIFSRGDGENGTRQFILSCCSINTSNALFAIIVLYLFQKPRNGALICVQEIMGDIRKEELLLFVMVVVTSSFLAFLLLRVIAKIVLKNMGNIRYDILCISGIVILTLLVYSLGGPLGILLCIISTSMGLMPPLLGVNRSVLMAFLLLPIMSYYI